MPGHIGKGLSQHMAYPAPFPFPDLQVETLLLCSLPQIFISDFVLSSNSEDMPETAIDEGLYLVVGRFGDTAGFTGIQKNTLHIGIEDSNLGLH